MDRKMKAAFDAWVQHQWNEFRYTPNSAEGAEWMLEYLRSPQEPAVYGEDDGIVSSEHRVCVYDLTPVTDVESALYKKLVEMGWTPPDLADELRRDAARYRKVRSLVSASNATGPDSWMFHADMLPKPLNNPLDGSVAQHFDEAIDAAIANMNAE